MKKAYQAGSGKSLRRRSGVSPALRESEMRYCALFESSHDAIMTIDPPSWRFTSVNLTTVRMFMANDVTEFTSREPWKLSPEKQPDGQYSVDKARVMIDIALRDGSHFFDWTHKRFNGEEFPATVLLTRMEISGKKFLQATVHDITRRKQIEKELEQASARLALATRAGGVGVWDYDIVNNILLWDDQMFALYGFENKAFSGVYEAWLAGIHPDDKVRCHLEIQMAIRGEKEFDTEFRVCWPDGSIHNIRAVAIVQRNATGQPMRMIGTNWDITELRKAEKEKLQESEERFRSLYENSTMGLYRTTPDGTIHLANPALVKMLGYASFDDLSTRDLQKNGFEPSHPRAQFVEIMEKKGEVIGLESAWKRKDGTIIFVRESARAFSDSKSKATYYDGTVEDITERKKLQEELLTSEKLAVMGRLVADVAHEINNPLAIIIGRTQLMLHRIDEQSLPLKGQLETVLQSARRCKTILSNMLTYSKTIGKQEHTVNLSDLIWEAIDAVNDQYEMSSIQVAFNCNLPINTEITGNKVALLSVFVNLIRNARQAMREKGNLTITAKKDAESQLRIEIHDTGIGLGKEQVSQLFQPFISGWEEEDGTGLGLATSLGIIETYGGKILAESEGKGKGATFTVVLPYTLKKKNTDQTNNKLEE